MSTKEQRKHRNFEMSSCLIYALVWPATTKVFRVTLFATTLSLSTRAMRARHFELSNHPSAEHRDAWIQLQRIRKLNFMGITGASVADNNICEQEYLVYKAMARKCQQISSLLVITRAAECSHITSQSTDTMVSCTWFTHPMSRTLSVAAPDGECDHPSSAFNVT